YPVADEGRGTDERGETREERRERRACHSSLLTPRSSRLGGPSSFVKEPDTNVRKAVLVPRRALGWGALALLAIALLAPHANRTVWHLNYWSRPYTLKAATDRMRSLPRGMLS